MLPSKQKWVEHLLWNGATGCTSKRFINFLAYLRNHRHRIPEYGYLQKQGLTIGSGRLSSKMCKV
jgi:hypothetical protein